jgi:hypothetical protein
MEKLCECGCGIPAPISPVNEKKWGYIKGQPRRFVRGHATRGIKYSDEIRSKLKKNGEKTQFKKGHKVYKEVIHFIRPFQNGEKHWNWHGGITPEVIRVRGSKKYYDWRTRVFKRDDYTCQFCKKRGVYIEADHYPTSFSILFREKRWKEMWDINNGRTLCRKCHDTTKDNHERFKKNNIHV